VLRNLAPVDRSWYDDRPPDPEYVVAPIWQTAESCLLAGQASVGKSYFVLPMHAAIGTGTTFFGFPVPKPRKSLYLMCERHVQSLAAALVQGLRVQWRRDFVPDRFATFEKRLHENCFLKGNRRRDAFAHRTRKKTSGSHPPLWTS